MNKNKNKNVIMLIVIFLCLTAGKPKDNSGLLCRILSSEKVVKYLHLEYSMKIKTIKIFDTFNLFKNHKISNSVCLGKEIKIINIRSKTKKPLEFEVLSFQNNKDNLKLVLKYDFEGITFYVNLPRNESLPIRIELIEN